VELESSDGIGVAGSKCSGENICTAVQCKQCASKRAACAPVPL